MFDGGPVGDGTRLLPGDDARARGGERAKRDVRDRRAGRHRRVTTRRRVTEALLVAALAPALPGVAHLRAGRTRTGAALLAVQAVLLTAAAVAAGYGRSLFLELSVRPGWLLALTAGAAVLAGLWAVLIVHSYSVLAPDGLSPPWRLAAAAALSVLCLVAAVPPLTVAHFGHLQRDLVTSVFAEERAGGGAPGPAGAPPGGDPWARIPRLNVLLVGGDADVGRPGVRTDSMTVASIDTATGNTVLLSLPRNLQRVPVWSGSERVSFPPGELLNSVYEDGLRRPEVLAGDEDVRNPGAELLKRTVGHILGRPVPYYAMVDMRSFRQIVDAVGGVRVCVTDPIPVPRQQVPAGVLEPGCRTLGGREALWYGRSRTGSDDYVRMGRQKCLMWALARQAGPLTVLRSFERLTEVFKESVSTDIPRRLLPPLIDLSAKVRTAEITSLQFVPPLISTGRPDYGAIRRMAARAVRDSAADSRGTTGLHILNNSCT